MPLYPVRSLRLFSQPNIWSFSSVSCPGVSLLSALAVSVVLDTRVADEPPEAPSFLQEGIRTETSTQDRMMRQRFFIGFNLKGKGKVKERELM